MSSCAGGCTHLRLFALFASADLVLDELGAALLVIQVLLLLPLQLLLATDGLGVTVDVLDVPAFWRLVNLAVPWEQHTMTLVTTAAQARCLLAQANMMHYLDKVETYLLSQATW